MALQQRDPNTSDLSLHLQLPRSKATPLRQSASSHRHNGASATPTPRRAALFDELRTVSAISIYDDADELSFGGDLDGSLLDDDSGRPAAADNPGGGRRRTETVGDWAATLDYCLEDDCQRYGQCKSRAPSSKSVSS